MEYIGSLQYDDKIIDEKQLVICGAGNDLSKILEQLANVNIRERVVMICDNNRKKWQTKEDNILIDSYESAYNQYPQAAYILYNQYRTEIYDQIKGKVEKIHMLWV